MRDSGSGKPGGMPGAVTVSPRGVEDSSEGRRAGGEASIIAGGAFHEGDFLVCKAVEFVDEGGAFGVRHPGTATR